MKMNTLLKCNLLGLPPTVNHIYCRGRNGNRYKTAAARQYQEQVSLTFANIWHGQPPYSGPVEVRITFITATCRKWDLDNRVKALQDCLMLSGVIKDDSQVQILHVERHSGKENQTQIELLSLE